MFSGIEYCNKIELTVKGNNAENEDQRENKDNNGVDLEAGGLISVETEHGAAGAPSTRSASAAWSGICNLLLLVSSSSPADCSTSTTGGRRRRRTGAGAGSDASSGTSW